MTIVTHTSPDWDAIGAVWLLQRYVPDGAGMPVVFVHTGNPDATVLASATYVVDTGRDYDPARGRFDHHQLATAGETSATEMVWRWLREMARGSSCVAPIIDLITDADGRCVTSPAATVSRAVGIHAMLSAWKAQQLSDAELLRRGMGVLDDIASTLIARKRAAETLQERVVWKSTDGRVWALLNGSRDATFAAFEEGAALVVFATTTASGTVAVGVQRASEQALDCGALVERALLTCDHGPVAAELRRWYRHPSGFFAGRGTAKAPDPTPLTVDLVTLARALAAVLD